MYLISFNIIFNENAIILAKRLNVPYIIDFSPKENDLIIVFGAHEQADKLYLIQQQIKCKYIIIQSEQFESKVFDNKYYLELLKTNYVLDWSKSNVERMKKHLDYKVYSFYFYDYFLNIGTGERPIDFFFCGTHNPTREKILTEFSEQNPSYKVEWDFSGNHMMPNTLNEKLKQVKYVINIPFYKNNALETHRINRALTLGCQVISVVSTDTYLNDKYKDVIHFVNNLTDFCPLLEMVPKQSFSDFIKVYGENQVNQNIQAILHIEKLNEKK